MSEAKREHVVEALQSAAIADFCTRWKITELALFGSALQPEFGPRSDIDLLVTFAHDTKWSLLDHVAMQQELEALLGRDVDLVSRRGLSASSNHLRRDEIFGSARVLYAESEN